MPLVLRRLRRCCLDCAGRRARGRYFSRRVGRCLSRCLGRCYRWCFGWFLRWCFGRPGLGRGGLFGGGRLGLGCLRRGGFGFGDRAGANEPAAPLDDLAESLPQLGPLAELLGQDVAGAEQGIGRSGDLAIGVDEIGRPCVQVGTDGVGPKDFQGQRFQAAGAGDGGQCLFLGLVGQIEVFQALGGAGGLDLPGERLGQLALRLDRPEDGLFPIGQEPHSCQPRLDMPDLFLVQTPRLVFPVPRDEGDRVPVVQQFNRRLDLAQRYAKTASHVPQIDGYRLDHSGWDRVGLLLTQLL